MASPQIENGYTTIANEILDHLYKQPLNGTELKVVMCILRYTFGFRRKSHKLSASFMTNKWKWAGERIAQIISEMIRNTERSLEGLAREMKSIGTRMGNNLANGISNATSGITRTLNNVVGKVNSTIGNINSALSGIERAFSFSYDVTGPTGNRRWGYYNMSLPRVNTIPYLAKGAVIPPRSEFLAVLGDQKQGNNIETPEALLRKIVREESGGQQSSGNVRFTAQINRRTVFDEIIEEAKLRRDTSGKNPFELA